MFPRSTADSQQLVSKTQTHLAPSERNGLAMEYLSIIYKLEHVDS